jgi:hypothetical protein
MVISLSAFTAGISLSPLISLIAGILILIMPRLLNFIVAIYLIIIGLVGVFHLWKHQEYDLKRVFLGSSLVGDPHDPSTTILRHRLMRTKNLNPPKKKKSATENAGDIRKERDLKPASHDVEEGNELKDEKGNLPPAMPPGG